MNKLTINGTHTMSHSCVSRYLMHSAYVLRSITLTYFVVMNIYHVVCEFATMIIHTQRKM